MQTNRQKVTRKSMGKTGTAVLPAQKQRATRRSIRGTVVQLIQWSSHYGHYILKRGRK